MCWMTWRVRQKMSKRESLLFLLLGFILFIMLNPNFYLNPLWSLFVAGVCEVGLAGLWLAWQRRSWGSLIVGFWLVVFSYFCMEVLLLRFR